MLRTLHRVTSTAVTAASTPTRLASRALGDASARRRPEGPTTDHDAAAAPPESDVGGSADQDDAPGGGLPFAGTVGDLPTLDDLLELVDGGADLLEDIVEEGVDLLEDTLGRHRRIWEDEDHDHAQIEVPAIADPAAVGLRQRLARSLSRFDGVRWAEVNAITGRVAVAFDGGESTLTALVQLIESVEESVGARRGERRPHWDVDDRADHPADAEPIHRTIAIIVGDVASLGWTVAGRAARVARLPVEVAGLVSIVDNNPWLRARAQQLLGRRAAALVLPLTGAVANGIAQGPFGTLVDLGLQTATLGELRARLEAWTRREPEFYAVHSDEPIDPPALPPRPQELPSGPVESWSAWAAGLGAGLAGTGLAVSRDPRFATDLLLATVPRAARLGREGYAAMLGRTLAKRGLVPLDGSSLRRLDRIDTVVLDSDVLLRARRTVRAVVTPSGSAPDEHVIGMTERLFDPDRETATASLRGWRLTPLADVDAATVRRARGALSRGREVRASGGVPLALLRGDELVAVVDVGHELDPAVEPVVEAIRDAGLRLVVADHDGRVARSLGADERVRTGDALGDDVRRLQGVGHGVMVVGRQGHRGLAAADVGVGVVARTGRPSWGADLILGREVADVATIVRACAVARDVSARATRFAMAGSALAGLVIVSGPRIGAGSRALAVVNGAAGAALIAGMWAAVELSHEPRPRRPDRSRWHALPAERVLAELGSDADRGLDGAELAQRRSEGAAPTADVSPLEPFLAELANPLNPILGVGAGLSAAAGSMADASLVLGLIGINTLVGGAQRLRADRTVGRLLSRAVEDVTVVRGGRSCRVPSDALVKGDVLVLVAGDAVPADARIVAADGCEVDESGLTGESLPVAKEVDPAPDTAIGDRSCMLYEDTTVVAGSARAVVVATGHATEVARSLALSGPPPRTGVELRLEELTRRLMPAALGVAAATGGVGLLRRWPLAEVAGTAVSLAIASVPEGLRPPTRGDGCGRAQPPDRRGARPGRRTVRRQDRDTDRGPGGAHGRLRRCPGAADRGTGRPGRARARRRGARQRSAGGRRPRGPRPRRRRPCAARGRRPHRTRRGGTGGWLGAPRRPAVRGVARAARRPRTPRQATPAPRQGCAGGRPRRV
jgi:cation-transporting P-type ATPase I